MQPAENIWDHHLCLWAWLTWRSPCGRWAVYCFRTLGLRALDYVVRPYKMKQVELSFSFQLKSKQGSSDIPVRWVDAWQPWTARLRCPLTLWTVMYRNRASSVNRSWANSGLRAVTQPNKEENRSKQSCASEGVDQFHEFSYLLPGVRDFHNCKRIRWKSMMICSLLSKTIFINAGKFSPTKLKETRVVVEDIFCNKQLAIRCAEAFCIQNLNIFCQFKECLQNKDCWTNSPCLEHHEMAGIRKECTCRGFKFLFSWWLLPSQIFCNIQYFCTGLHGFTAKMLHSLLQSSFQQIRF